MRFIIKELQPEECPYRNEWDPNELADLSPLKSLPKGVYCHKDYSIFTKAKLCSRENCPFDWTEDGKVLVMEEVSSCGKCMWIKGARSDIESDYCGNPDKENEEINYMEMVRQGILPTEGISNDCPLPKIEPEENDN